MKLSMFLPMEERVEKERRELKGAEASIHNMPLISSFAAQKLITPTMGTLETLKTLGEVDNEGKIYVPQWRRRKKKPMREKKRKTKKTVTTTTTTSTGW